MDKNIIEASQLPEGDKIYLKKDWLGWRIVHPHKDPQTGKYNLFNVLMGGKRNAIVLLFLGVLGIFAYLGIKALIAKYQFPFEQPLEFCFKYVRLIP